jgi:hypothetical protein
MRMPGVAVRIGDVVLREEVIALPFYGSCSPASDALLHHFSRFRSTDIQARISRF